MQKFINSKASSGFLALFLAAMIYGSFGLWIRILNESLTVYQQIAMRNLFAFLIAGMIFLPRFFQKREKSDRKNSKIDLLIYAFVIPLGVILFNFSAIAVKIAVVTCLFYAASVITSYAIGYFGFSEKITLVRIISLILSLTGLGFLIYSASSEQSLIGFFLGILSGTFDSIGTGFRKKLSGKMDKLELTLITSIGGVLVSTTMMTYTGTSFNFILNMAPATWALTAIFGSLLVAVNYLLLFGFQRFDISLGTIVLSAEIVLAIIFGFLFLKEIPSQFEMIGAVLILCAMILPNLPEKPKSEGMVLENQKSN